MDKNSRMGKIRNLFKKIRDTKETFHVNMGTTKDQNKKSWQEYTEELNKQIFMTQIITMVWSLAKSQTSWNMKSSGP